jgi:hypothetical protein
MTDEATVIDGEATETDAEGRELTVAAPASRLAVTPQVQATELVERMNVIRQATDQAMERDVDYGVIPGTNKPALLKPGAEKLGVLFQLDIQLANEKVWGPDDHLTVISKATVYYAPTGERLGFGEGLCTTREKKYAKRKQDRLCPECGTDAIKRSKYPPRDNPHADPGWYCFAKIGGCGANFAANDPKITEQEVGEKDNPEIPDCWNTVVKMAEKRARVDAVLAVTGASALFTQDVEDAPRPEPTPAPEPEPVEPIGKDEAKELVALAIASGLTEGQIVSWARNKGIQADGPAACLAQFSPDLAARFRRAVDDAAGAET